MIFSTGGTGIGTFSEEETEVLRGSVILIFVSKIVKREKKKTILKAYPLNMLFNKVAKVFPMGLHTALHR